MEVSTVADMPKFQRFCDACGELGYVNNDTIEKHKLDWIQTQDGIMLYAYHDDEMIGVAGCHRINDNDFRVCFRGAQLPGKDTYTGMSKLHFNSIPWRLLLPYQIDWCSGKGAERLFVTTNADRTDARLAHTNRAMHILAKRGIVMHHKTDVYFDVLQNFWLLNVGAYNESREVLHNRD